MGEDNQITPTSFDLCVRRGQVRATALRAPVQPEEVHAAAALRLPGVERVLEVGLSQAGGVAGGYARFVQSDRVGQGSALHDVSKGGSTLALGGAGAAPVGSNDPRRSGGAPDEEARGHGGAGWHRLRVAPREQLLCAATRK